MIFTLNDFYDFYDFNEKTVINVTPKSIFFIYSDMKMTPLHDDLFQLLLNLLQFHTTTTTSTYNSEYSFKIILKYNNYLWHRLVKLIYFYVQQ